MRLPNTPFHEVPNITFHDTFHNSILSDFWNLSFLTCPNIRCNDTSHHYKLWDSNVPFFNMPQHSIPRHCQTLHSITWSKIPLHFPTRHSMRPPRNPFHDTSQFHFMTGPNIPSLPFLSIPFDYTTRHFIPWHIPTFHTMTLTSIAFYDPSQHSIIQNVPTFHSMKHFRIPFRDTFQNSIQRHNQSIRLLKKIHSLTSPKILKIQFPTINFIWPPNIAFLDTSGHSNPWNYQNVFPWDMQTFPHT